MILPATVLALCLPLIFIVPQWIGTHVITPAFRGVVHTEAIVQTAPHLAQWHGFNLPLLMSVTVIVLGIVGVFSVDRLRKRFYLLKRMHYQLKIFSIRLTSHWSVYQAMDYVI